MTKAVKRPRRFGRVKEPWRPTAEQRTQVTLWLNDGWSAEDCRKRLLQVSTGNKVSLAMFEREFALVIDSLNKNRTTAAIFPVTEDMRNTVMSAVVAGVKHEIIARMVINPITACHITVHQLEQLFPHELAGGEEVIAARVTRALVRNATEHMEVRAQTFYLKSKRKWRETDNPDEKDPDSEKSVLVVPGTAEDPTKWEENAKNHAQNVQKTEV